MYRNFNNLLSTYRNWVWHRKLCHAYKEKRENRKIGKKSNYSNKKATEHLQKKENYKYQGISGVDTTKQRDNKKSQKSVPQKNKKTSRNQTWQQRSPQRNNYLVSPFCKIRWSILCCILTLDRAINQRCTCVNKRKKKRKQVGVMKEYRQVPAAVELVRDRKATVRASLQTEGWATPAKMRKKCCYGHKKKLDQYSSLSLSPLISHTPQKHWE